MAVYVLILQETDGQKIQMIAILISLKITKREVLNAIMSAIESSTSFFGVLQDYIPF